MNQDSTNQTAKKNDMTDNIFLESVSLGLKLGLLLSTIYAVLGSLIVFLTEIKDTINIFQAALIFPAALVLASPVILLLAILPSIIVGGWTGMIMGRIAESRFAKQISKIVFTVISIITCILIALLMHIIFGIKVVLSFESSSSEFSLGAFETYPFDFGIPTIIYFIAGGWFGWKIHSKLVNSKEDNHALPRS